MLSRFSSVALVVALCGALPATAQNVRDIPAPRELPPVSFKGAQFVDSGGCVFVRAGIDGRVMWVPRVNGARKVLCGYPPSFAAAAPPPDAPAVTVSAPPALRPAVQTAPAPAPRTPMLETAARADGPRCPARAPIRSIAPLQGGGTVILCLSRAGLLDQPATIARLEGAAPLPTRVAAGGDTVLVCPRTAPIAQRLALAAGGTTLLCTAADGSLADLAIPGRRAASSAPVATNAPMPTLLAAAAATDLLQPVVPQGYKLAWQDNRLNANRARGTAAGQAAQDRVWTRETPARLVSAAPQPVLRVSTQTEPARLRVSTMGQAATHYVQVGSFAQTANADAAAMRLADLGLPVAARPANKGGRAVVVVMAGPFDADQARAALALTRRSGFANAILR